MRAGWASCSWLPRTRRPPAATSTSLRAWVPAAQAGTVQLATCDEQDAPETLARFRLTAEPSVLVTVAMAAEGMDAPEVAVVGLQRLQETGHVPPSRRTFSPCAWSG